MYVYIYNMYIQVSFAIGLLKKGVPGGLLSGAYSPFFFFPFFPQTTLLTRNFIDVVEACFQVRMYVSYAHVYMHTMLYVHIYIRTIM